MYINICVCVSICGMYIYMHNVSSYAFPQRKYFFVSQSYKNSEANIKITKQSPKRAIAYKIIFYIMLKFKSGIYSTESFFTESHSIQRPKPSAIL